jgi:L-serine dehydratase
LSIDGGGDSRAIKINLAGRIHRFDEQRDLIFDRDMMYPPGAQTQHPNGLRLKAFDAAGAVLDRAHILFHRRRIHHRGRRRPAGGRSKPAAIPFPFHSAAELLATAHANELSISQLMLENECALVRAPRRFGRAPVEWCAKGIDRIWQAMQTCVERGIATEGILARRIECAAARASAGRAAAREGSNRLRGDPLAPLDWVTVYAMAVNEENAAGGRVVTAPTNGAAGVVPAVAHYYERFISEADHEGMMRFFLTSAAIGILIRRTLRSAARRLVARAKWAWPAPWPPAD